MMGVVLAPALLGASSLQPAAARSGDAQTVVSSIQTVFVILMADTNWSSIKNSPSAPYINTTLLPAASHAEQYYTPQSIHPGAPNAIWLEAGANAFPDRTFTTNDDPGPGNSTASTNHLVSQIARAGLTWRSYQEDITGISCPLQSDFSYTTAHNPVVYFTDITEGNNANSLYCRQRIRPFTELAGDLQRDTVATYNFISPNVCNSMRDACGSTNDRIRQGDSWLSQIVPAIQGSTAFLNNGALFIVWDQGERNGDGPIGMIALSPLARGNGYAGSVRYDHSSTVLTIQEIFGLTPPLQGAAQATDLSDLFLPDAFTVATATPTPTETPAPTATMTSYVYVIPTNTPTATATLIPTPSATPQPFYTPTETPTPN